MVRSHVTHHTSHVKRHTSHVTRHTSQVSRHHHPLSAPVAPPLQPPLHMPQTRHPPIQLLVKPQTPTPNPEPPTPNPQPPTPPTTHTLHIRTRTKRHQTGLCSPPAPTPPCTAARRGAVHCRMRVKPQTINHKPQTINHKPQTPNPKPQTTILKLHATNSPTVLLVNTAALADAHKELRMFGIQRRFTRKQFFIPDDVW